MKEMSAVTDPNAPDAKSSRQDKFLDLKARLGDTTKMRQAPVIDSEEARHNAAPAA